ncbi:zinc ion binding [Blomia tropicalis]|nr:zinc ion binding [Blomia tropicalis]
MGRRPGEVKICVICNDKAKGINFNAPTCMSCKAFFRRNALSNKDLKCHFNNNCKINKITRRFCTKCRLKKCFDSGMIKEWILSDSEKEMIKEKIRLNKIKKQKEEENSKQKTKNQENSCGSELSRTSSISSWTSTKSSSSIKTEPLDEMVKLLSSNTSKNNDNSKYSSFDGVLNLSINHEIGNNQLQTSLIT